jgi:hypothetical protein
MAAEVAVVGGGDAKKGENFMHLVNYSMIHGS